MKKVYMCSRPVHPDSTILEPTRIIFSRRSAAVSFVIWAKSTGNVYIIEEIEVC